MGEGEICVTVITNVQGVDKVCYSKPFLIALLPKARFLWGHTQFVQAARCYDTSAEGTWRGSGTSVVGGLKLHRYAEQEDELEDLSGFLLLYKLLFFNYSGHFLLYRWKDEQIFLKKKFLRVMPILSHLLTHPICFIRCWLIRGLLLLLRKRVKKKKKKELQP